MATSARRMRVRGGLLPQRLRRPGVAVAAAYALVTAYLMANAVKVLSFIWLTDEVLWFKSARSFAEGTALLSPEVRGEATGPPNGLYPRILSPLYALLDAPAAYTATHVVNALLFASALVPVYLLARRVGLNWRWALAGGVMSVVLPWATVTLVVMTEPLTYPLFLWTFYAIVVAVAEPRPRHDLLALAAILVTAYARTQFITLGVVLVAAIAARELVLRDGWPARRARLRAHAPLAAVLVVAPLVYVALRSAGVDLVGTYGGLFDANPFPSGFWNASILHVAYLISGTAVVPFVLWIAWMVRVSADRGTPHELSLAIVGAITFVLTVYQAGFFAQTLVGGLPQERYVFYVVPIFLVAMLLVVSDVKRPSPRLSVAGAGVLAAGLVAAGGWEAHITGGAFGGVASAGRAMNPLVSQTLVNWFDRSPTESVVIGVALIALLVIPALELRRRLRFMPALIAGAIAIALALQSVWLLDETRDGMNVYYPSQLQHEDELPKNWVDRAVGQNAGVAFFAGELPDAPEDGVHWAYTEFFNYSVDAPAIVVGDRPNPNNFAMRKARLDPLTGRIIADFPLPEHVITPTNDPTTGLRGAAVARTRWGATLMKPEVPWSVAYHVLGATYGGNALGTTPIQVRVYEGAKPTPVELELFNDDALAPLTWTVQAGKTRRTGVLARTERVRIRMTTVPDGPSRSSLRILPPPPQELPDGRQVGLRARVVSVG